MLTHQLFHRIDGIKPAVPETFVVPGILANADGQPQAVQLNNMLLPGRREIALLVEHVVERQQALMLLQLEMSAVQQDRRVDGRLSAPRLGGQSHARNHGCGHTGRGRGQFIHGRAAAGQEAGFFKEVSRRIATDGQFGKNGEPGALCGSPPAGGNNLLKISAKVPHSGIDLRQCDLHSFSLIPQMRMGRLSARRPIHTFGLVA